MLFDAITAVETFVDVFTTVYMLTIFVYLLTSWVQLPYSLRPVQRFLAEVCDPYVRFWRRLLPLQFGAFDFSPMVGIFALLALDRILRVGLDRLH